MEYMDKSSAKSKNEKYMKRMLKGSQGLMGHASKVIPIQTNTEQYDMGKIRWDSVGTKGYPKEAFKYDY